MSNRTALTKASGDRRQLDFIMRFRRLGNGRNSGGWPWIAASGRLLLVAVVMAALDSAPAAQRVSSWMAQAQAAAVSGQTVPAADLLDRALAVTGPQALPYDWLAATYARGGDYHAAEMYLGAAANVAGWSVSRRERLAQVMEASGDNARAAALRLAAGSERADESVLMQIAETQIARHAWTDAGDTLLRVLALAPGNAAAQYWLGLLLAAHDPRAADVHLAAAGADPGFELRAERVRAALAAYAGRPPTEARTRLGVALVELAEWPFSERALDAALAASGANPQARAYRGYARDRQGRDGWPDLAAARAMSPNDPVIHYLIGLYWRGAGDEPKAADALLRAYSLDPQNPALAAELGISAKNRGDLAAAAVWLRRAVDSAPREGRWRQLLAAFYADAAYDLGVGGLAFIVEAQSLAPDDADIAASLGWAYHQSGDAERAYEALSRAVRLDPTQVRARYYFGAVLERQGDRIGALDSYQFVWDTAGPENQFGVLAQRALERLGEPTS